ncbi:hypothetical protein TARUN_5116 [Trichoderma arundinaceum]|uniref:Uncharacterized protein n=1 Tax=Trichoderma arundinaceum TaxID=490622 RepID=A0A395NMJ0_TRIAR|nr:hypothetical protein TARUN_5116 [Trichoderma arundinaceum]
MNFSYISFGQVDSIAALANSPAYMRGHDLTNATFVRCITILPHESRIYVNEAAVVHDKQFYWSYYRPKSDYAALVGDMWQSSEAEGEAAVALFISMCHDPSMEATMGIPGRLVILEFTSEMEAFVVHTGSE